MGHFTEESLTEYQALISENLDFGESPVYDFAMCLKSDGDVYGIEPGETCKDGKPISDNKAAALRSKDLKTRMAKLKAAFLKKTGREMTKEELKKAMWMKGAK